MEHEVEEPIGGDGDGDPDDDSTLSNSFDEVFKPVARSVRKFPSLVISSLRLAYRASPGIFIVTTMLQTFSGLGVAAQLLLGKNVLTVVLHSDRTTGSFDSAVPSLILLLAITIALAFSQALQGELGTILSERVARLAYERILDVSEAVELSAYESPQFFDRLQRALYNGSTRPYQMVSGLVGLVTSGVTVAAICAVLIALQPVVLPVAVGAYLPLWLAMTRNSRSYYEFRFEMTKLDRQRFYLLRVLTGRDEAKEVRAFRLSPLLRTRYSTLYDRYIDGLKRVARVRIKRSVLASFGTSGLTILVLGLLGYLYLGGHIALAAAGTAVAALLQLSSRLQSFVSSAGSIYEGSLFLDDYKTFVDLLPMVKRSVPTEPAPGRFTRLVADHVAFTYPGAHRPALEDICVDIHAGEIVALVGENGSGKTTLAKLLANLYTPTSGQILWDGRNIAELDPDSVRSSMAVIFQDFVKYLMTAHDNVAAGRSEHVSDRDRVLRAAREADAHNFLSTLREGYDTILGKEFDGGRDLSIGQWQRVALARAFFRDAPFVILDEPTSALDPRAEYELFERIRTLLAGRSVLLISHRFSSVRSADRIYVLDKGRVREHGTHDELMARNGLYAELFTLQAAAYLDQGVISGPRRA